MLEEVVTPDADHITDFQERPALPLDNVGSITILLQELTVVGVDMDTDGVTGDAGDEIETVTFDVDALQVTPVRQLGFTVPDTNSIELKTCKFDVTVAEID